MGYTIKPMAKEAPALVAVPDDVATDLEGLWEFLAANPDQVAYAKFDTPDERETFIKQARSWGRMREAGALAFRKLAGASLGDDELRFTINVPPTPEEIAAAKAKREAEGKKSPGRPKVNTPAK